MIHKAKLTVIVICISAISMPVFAGLDTAIQRVGESLRPKQTFENMQKGFTFGNIYSSAHDLAKKEFLGSTTQALSDMTKDLNYSYSCDLEIADATNILLTIDSSRNDIQAMVKAVHEQIDAKDTQNFVSSCTKLIQCATKGKTGADKPYQYDKTNKTTELTDNGFNNCKALATNAYNRNVESASISIGLASTNAGNDMYYNGTLDDSPYDILVDIQRIGDVLFTTNEQTSKVLFYTFPNNSVAGFQAIPFNSDSRYTSSPNSIAIGGNTTTAGSSNASNTSNPINNNSASMSTGFVSTNLNGGNSGTGIHAGGYNNTTPIYVDTTNTVTDGGIIDNYACIPGTATSGTGITNADSGNNSNSQDNGNIGDIQNTDGNPINNQSPFDNININNPIFDATTPYYSPIVGSNDDPIANNDSLEDPGQYEQQAAQIQSCTSKCGGLKGIDKSMCIAKCMCGTTYTKDGVFGLSICTIPTKQTDIVSSKPVQSIQEIVTEINNVLNNLKNSGEMMKHTKTTEFLDTSMSKIKLNKIFSFDINMSFKPIIDAKPRRMSDAEVENNSDNILKGTYGDINIGAEKNKYTVLYNAAATDTRETAQNFQDIQNKIKTSEAEYTGRYQQIDQSLTDTIVLSQNAEVNDIIKNFLEQNIRFRTFVNDSITKIQETAGSIEQKIEKGK